MKNDFILQERYFCSWIRKKRAYANETRNVNKYSPFANIPKTNAQPIFTIHTNIQLKLLTNLFSKLNFPSIHATHCLIFIFRKWNLCLSWGSYHRIEDKVCHLECNSNEIFSLHSSGGLNILPADRYNIVIIQFLLVTEINNFMHIEMSNAVENTRRLLLVWYVAN